MNKNIFNCTNYLKILEDHVEAKKQRGIKYNYKSLADALGIQKSYLSKVLAGRAHLSSDQLYLMAQEMQMSDDELYYLNLLVEAERTGLAQRRAQLKSEIEKIRKLHLKTEAALQLSELIGEDLNRYYTNAWTQVIHVALTIPRFSKSPSKLKEIFSIDEVLIQETLELLEKLGVIEWQGEKVIVIRSSLHLSKDSPYFWSWRNQLSLLGQMKSLTLPKSVPYNFSVVFSATSAVNEKVHELFLEYLKQVEVLVKNSDSEELYQMNYDLIPWTKLT